MRSYVICIWFCMRKMSSTLCAIFFELVTRTHLRRRRQGDLCLRVCGGETPRVFSRPLHLCTRMGQTRSKHIYIWPILSTFALCLINVCFRTEHTLYICCCAWRCKTRRRCASTFVWSAAQGEKCFQCARCVRCDATTDGGSK